MHIDYLSHSLWTGSLLIKLKYRKRINREIYQITIIFSDTNNASASSVHMFRLKKQNAIRNEIYQ